MTRALPISERTFPHNSEAECALLGSVLMDNGVLNVALEQITGDDFYSEANRLIFEAIVEMSEQGRVIELVTLSEQLSKRGMLNKVGGASHLASLTTGVPIGSSGAVAEYARIIREKAIARRLINASNNVIARCLEATDSSEDLVNLALSQIFEIAQADKKPSSTYLAAAKATLVHLQRQDVARIMTGITEVDSSIGGFLPQELVILTGETGVAKTALAQQIRRRACGDGHHGLFASGEMSRTHLLARELATQGGVPHWKMRQPEKLTGEEFQRLINVTIHECQRCRILDGEISLARIAVEAHKLKADSGLDLIVIDYDELVDAPGESEFERLTNLTRGAKRLGVQLDCVVIMISQLRKRWKDEGVGFPSLARLYGTGAKPKHAQVILYIERKYVETLEGDRTKAAIWVLKNRDGEQGKVDLRFNVRTLRFESPNEPSPEPIERAAFDAKAAAAGDDEAESSQRWLEPVPTAPGAEER